MGPARILGLDRGVLTPGKVADITIIDPNESRQVDPQRFFQRKEQPLQGYESEGMALCDPG